MLDEHSIVGIVQVIFYVPAIVLTAYLRFRNGKGQREWFILCLFSLIRFSGGILVILVERDPNNTGLVIATIVLLGIGVPPLLGVGVAFVRTLCALGFDDKPAIRLVIHFLRILFIASVICLIAGGTVAGDSDTTSTVLIGLELLQAAICLLVVVFAILVILYGYLYYNKDRLTTISIHVLKGTAVALPFILVRIIYAFLSYFSSDPVTSQWSPLYGSLGAYVGMGLIMEYAAVVIYVGVGLFTIVHGKKIHHQSAQAKVIRADGGRQESDSRRV